MTKLIFMGTPDFSATVLKGLLTDDRYDILAVVTQPDRAVGRKKVIQETPVKQAAKEAGLPIYQPEKLSGSPEMGSFSQVDSLIAWTLLSTFTLLFFLNIVVERLSIMP